MHYSFRAEVRMALISLEMFQNWKEVVGSFREIFAKLDSFELSIRMKPQRLKLNVEMQRQLGAVVELIDKHQLRELEPDWQVEDVELAAYEPDSGYGDGAGVAGDFLAAARDLGTTYLARTQATELIVESDRVKGVVTTGGIVSVPIVIVAMGPWTRPCWPAQDMTCRSTVNITRSRFCGTPQG